MTTDPAVLRIITRLNIGGPSRHALLLSAALPSHGYSTHLAWGAISPGEGQVAVPTDVPNTHVPDLRREIRPGTDIRAFRELRRLARSRGPEIVHTHLAKAGALGRLAARRARVPVVVHTYHGHVLQGYFSPPASRAILLAEQRLARRTDALIAVSEQIRDGLVSLGVGRPEQWRVIPLGLDLSELLRPLPEPATARRSLSLPDTGPTVGIVGRLTAIKDHATFLRAAARIAHAHPDVTFVVAGDGELRPSLERAARDLLGDRCRFLGWVMDLPTLYAALDVALLTSRNEGTPVALIEAAASGRPVVATRVGGVADVVVEGRTGHLAPPGDAAAIAGHVLRLLADPGEATALGAAGREWVAGRFGVDRLANDLALLYQELLAAKGLRAPA